MGLDRADASASRPAPRNIPLGEAIDERATFQPLLAAQQADCPPGSDHTSDLTNLSFTENQREPGQRADALRPDRDSETAHALLSRATATAATAGIIRSTATMTIRSIGNYAWTTFLHETGHALGLKHGHESPALSPYAQLARIFGHDLQQLCRRATGDDGGYTNEQFGYPQTFMMFDIAALQRLYGADFGFNSGNSVYSWNPASGAFSINGATQFTPGANRVFMTVWDGGGTDTYDLSNYSSGGVTIDLRPGEWSVLSAVQRANLGDGRYAVGNVANALLYNDDPRSLIENAIGTSGNDTITGNSAVNRLTGGAGADRSASTMPRKARVAAPDTITDFTVGRPAGPVGDGRQPRHGGDDIFHYLGTGAFTGQAGQLRHERVGSDVIVFGDIDGDGIADLQIILQNAPDLSATNFLL